MLSERREQSLVASPWAVPVQPPQVQGRKALLRTVFDFYISYFIREYFIVFSSSAIILYFYDAFGFSKFAFVYIPYSENLLFR